MCIDDAAGCNRHDDPAPPAGPAPAFPFPPDTPRTTRFAKGDAGPPPCVMHRGDFALAFTSQEERCDRTAREITGRTGEVLAVERSTTKYGSVCVRDQNYYVIVACRSEAELDAFVAAYGMVWEDPEERTRLRIGPNDDWAPLNVRSSPPVAR